MECIIYMGAVDCERQKLNVFRMKMLGAKVRWDGMMMARVMTCFFECVEIWGK